MVRYEFSFALFSKSHSAYTPPSASEMLPPENAGRIDFLLECSDLSDESV
jgi:hypothetical protein